MNSPTHPIWAIIRLGMLMFVLTIVLWLNASKFDATEVKTLVEYFLVAASLEGGMMAAKSMFGGKKD